MSLYAVVRLQSSFARTEPCRKSASVFELARAPPPWRADRNRWGVWKGTPRRGALGCVQERGGSEQGPPGVGVSAGLLTTRRDGTLPPGAQGFLAGGESMLKPAGMVSPSPLFLQGRISSRQIRGVGLEIPRLRAALSPRAPQPARGLQRLSHRVAPHLSAALLATSPPISALAGPWRSGTRRRGVGSCLLHPPFSTPGVEVNRPG